LVYEIRDKKACKSVEADISTLLRTRFKGKSGIIYCLRRKDCEKLSEVLNQEYKIKCDYYHADLSIAKRSEIQSKWMKDEI